MARTATTLGFSVAPELKEEIENMAVIEGISKSQLFREMVEVYKIKKKQQEFRIVQREISQLARKAGIYTEEDVLKMLEEDKKG